MHLKSVILEGFKSYGKRTEVHGFDPEFTAITGLNGSGKSNLLDSICYVLGISNLGAVRAANSADLVHKGPGGSATKATVTLVFDNSNAAQCPLGYEKCREISVTRQTVIGGKNKYMINGKNVPNKKIEDLFCSVQLNVNNPNFLIMQGRITKVLNMKPPEILSMMEEAAGTSVYESKRDATTKLIEKKDLKVRETNTLLKEDIEPKLEKLRKERAAYVEFQKLCRDIEYLTRIHVSKTYLVQKEILQKAESHYDNVVKYIEDSKQKIESNQNEVLEIEQTIKEMQHKIDNECGGELTALEEQLATKTSEEAKISGSMKVALSSLEQEKKKLKLLSKNIKDDEDALNKKEAQMEKVKNLFQGLKDADERDAKAYTDAQKKFEAVTQGLSTNDEGEASSLQDQLMTAKQQIIEAETTIKTCELELKHSRNVLRQKESELQTNDTAYLKDKEMFDKIEANVKSLKTELSKIKYEDGSYEQLEHLQGTLSHEIRQIKSQLDRKNAYRYELQYRDPEPNFDRRKVRGMVGKLFSVRSERDCLALMMCAGGSLYSYVTDDDVTSKKILQKGQLQHRVTIIPINKITSSVLNPSIVQTAQNLVGRENVASALSLIEYDSYFEPVMRYVFGHTLVCKDMNVAKKVTYHNSIMSRSVTLDGDIVDPEGTLSGGSRPKGGNILQELAEIKRLEEEIWKKETECKETTLQLRSLQAVSKNYNNLKERLELRQHELNVCSNRLAQTTFQQNKDEIAVLKEKIASLEQEIKSAREKQVTANKKVKDIEGKLADAKGFRERELKAASEEMIAAKKKSEESRANWKKREQEYETLRLEIEEIRKSLELSQAQLLEKSNNVEAQEAQTAELRETVEASLSAVAELKAQIKAQKDKINLQNRELKAQYARKDKLRKQSQEIQLEIKKKETELSKAKSDRTSVQQQLERLEEKYSWIKEDQEFFGLKNTRYDYSKEDPEEAGAKLSKMRELKGKMERNINLKAMMLLDREEEQYKETMRRKKIVEEDKEKIKNIIYEMDEKAKDKLDKSWKSVNENFSSIFSTLLPGAQAKLHPVYQNNSLYGLTIKVGFNGLWKETLGELSGGQRSLVALSLILAMLKFSPAPLYILDEVDAALDMSHTQNIGNMLKSHFTNSQFIIVSLKDGMFNNANVLFRTKFDEGTTAITRTVNVSRRKFQKKKLSKVKIFIKMDSIGFIGSSEDDENITLVITVRPLGKI